MENQLAELKNEIAELKAQVRAHQWIIGYLPSLLEQDKRALLANMLANHIKNTQASSVELDAPEIAALLQLEALRLIVAGGRSPE